MPAVTLEVSEALEEFLPAVPGPGANLLVGFADVRGFAGAQEAVPGAFVTCWPVFSSKE